MICATNYLALNYLQWETGLNFLFVYARDIFNRVICGYKLQP